MSGQHLRVAGVTVDLSKVDKVLFPEDGITKGDLIDYYRQVADHMLPALKDRPLTLQRFPNGLSGKGFIQQHASDYFPDWVDRATLPLRRGGRIEHILCGTTATLVYLANQAAITLHPWLSRVDRPEHPDQMIFDLDPPGDEFEPARRAARALRTLLDELGLPALLKTTGGRGLHVTVPIARWQEFDAVRDLARQVAATLAAREPRRVTTEARKAKRRGRLYLDTARNAYGQTAVAPYAVRARRGAPVAAPLHWSELDDARLTPQRFTLRTMARRLADDPWQDAPAPVQALTETRRRLHTLHEEAA